MDDGLSPFVRDSRLWELRGASGVGVVSATQATVVIVFFDPLRVLQNYWRTKN